MYATVEGEKFGTVVEAVYDAAVSPERAPAMLAAIADLFEANFADLYACTHDRTRRHGVVHGLDDADYQGEMLGYWAQRNVWTAVAPIRVAGEVTSTRELVSKEQLIRSAMFNDYLAPRGLHEGMRIGVWAGEMGIEDISLLRPFSVGPFGAREKALGEALFPHLSRAALVRRRLEEAELTARAGLSGLDTLHHPVLLLDQIGRPVFVNAAADALLRGGDGLALHASRLAGCTPAATRLLDAALRRAAGDGAAPVATTVRLPCPSGRSPLAVVALPLRWDGAWTQGRHPAILLCIGGPGPSEGEADAAAWHHIAKLFRLTDAEAALAADLLGGFSLAMVARKRGRSLQTVKTHLAKLMAKTDTNRQSELLRLLLACPRSAERSVQGLTVVASEAKQSTPTNPQCTGRHAAPDDGCENRRS